MFRTIFRKTLYEKRWLLLWWFVITLLMVVGSTALFPLFKDSLSNLTNVPDELKALVGDSAAYSTMTGWLNLQVFAQMSFAGIILGITVGGGVLAGEENEGTLQSLLALPVRRGIVYWQKFAAVATMVGAVTVCLFLGSWIGVVLIKEHVGLWPLLLATLMAYLVSLLFAALTYVIGAISGRRGIAGTMIGLFAFVSFMLTSLAAGIKALRYPDYLSPFHYYNTPSPLIAGFQYGDAAVLLLASLILLAIGYRVFIRRDIYQR